MGTRYRWINDGCSPIGPRDGATVRQIDEPRPPRREQVHVHLRAAKVADQAGPAGGLPAARRDQNVEPEEAGFRDRGIAFRDRDQTPLGGRRKSAS
jgi:hypothetical protein